MNKNRKTKFKIIYAFFLGMLFSLTLVFAVKAFHTLYTKDTVLSKRDIELGLKLRKDESLNSKGSKFRAPYVMFRPKPNNKLKPTINSLGFHSPEIAKEKAADEYRIAMVGGSVVFTSGPSYSDTNYLEHSIIANLAKVLKERLPGLIDKKVTYVNAGIPSGVSGQELAQLMHHIIPLNIDLLIVYDGFNDFYIPFNYERRPGYPYDYIVEEYRFIKGREGIGGKDGLSNMNEMYHELGISIPGYEEAKKEILEQYLFNIMEMSIVANGFGISTGVFLQPYSERDMNPLLSIGNQHSMKLYSAAQKVFRLLGKENNPKIVFQDMTYMNDRLDSLFMDIAHTWWNPSHQMIADEIFKHLDAAGMFENLKANTSTALPVNPPYNQLYPTQFTAFYYDRIREVLDTTQVLLKGVGTENELARFKSIGGPGMGNWAEKSVEKYYANQKKK